MGVFVIDHSITNTHVTFAKPTTRRGGRRFCFKIGDRYDPSGLSPSSGADNR